MTITLPSTGTDVVIGLTATDASGAALSVVRDVVFGAPPTLTPTPTATSTATPIGLAGPFLTGDVLVAIDQGEVEVHRPDGTLRGVLHATTGRSPDSQAGMALDTAGNLYVTDFHNQTVSRFDNTGHLLGTVGGSWTGIGCPESILFDASGNVYVGAANGCKDAGEPATIRKFDSAWNLISEFSAQHEDRGTDWIDLANDSCTMLYTSEGRLVKRFNVCTNTQLEDLTKVQLPSEGTYALRLRPNGGVLVANSTAIVNLDAAGNVVRTYAVPGEHKWFALTLDPDGTSFWSVGFDIGVVHRFDIGSGRVLSTFPARRATAGGLTVVGEITAARSTGAPTVTPAPTAWPTGVPTWTPTPTPTETPTPTATPLPPDFGLNIAIGSQPLLTGGSTDMTVTINPINAFHDVVALSTTALPTGLSAKFTPTSFTPPGTSILTLSLAADAPDPASSRST